MTAQVQGASGRSPSQNGHFKGPSGGRGNLFRNAPSTGSPLRHAYNGTSNGISKASLPALDGGIEDLRLAELELIDPRNDGRLDGALQHERQTAPLITFDAYQKVPNLFPQVSLLGSVVSQIAVNAPVVPQDRRLYINTNAPLSGLICGVQGSGKSHTSSVILENFLLKSDKLGTSQGGLAGLVFHFGNDTLDGGLQPCEAAYLSQPTRTNGPCAKVTVLVTPTNYEYMCEVYEDLPVDVQPLHFSSRDITAARMLAMMVTNDHKQRPLYIEKVMSMLRARQANSFVYEQFCKELFAQRWSEAQRGGLEQRLSVLDGFLKGGNDENRAANFFRPGTLTIVDLSDPFYDPISCSGIFDLVLGMFDEVDLGDVGKFILLDEAHKYLTSQARLTASILSLIRQQRHRGMRVIISTQEPTVVEPTVLDLVSFVIIHRFSSPSWAAHLDKHIRFTSPTTSAPQQNWFNIASSLETGEALVFSPAGTALRGGKAVPIGTGHFRIQTRRRLTRDAGGSVLVTSMPPTPARR